MQKVIVTGARGFVGLPCVKFLRAVGYEVHALTSSPVPQAEPSTYWHQVDLNNRERTAACLAEIQATHLLHLAWVTAHGQYWTSLDNFSWVQASLHLLQCFAASGGRRVVMAGTCAEYDWRSQGNYTESHTSLNPATPYGVCKNALRGLMESYCEVSGLSSAWGRIFFLFGPGENSKRLVPNVICALLQNQPALCTSGNQVRDFLYVLDAADAIVSLLNSNVQGSINVASGQPTSVRELVLSLGLKLAKPRLIHMGALPDRADEPPQLVADVSRLRRELNWHPRHTIGDGLEASIHWWQEQLSLRSR